MSEMMIFFVYFGKLEIGEPLICVKHVLVVTNDSNLTDRDHCFCAWAADAVIVRNTTERTLRDGITDRNVYSRSSS